MSAHTSVYAALALLACILLWYYRSRIMGRKTHQPPSPPSFPVVGSLLSIPAGQEHIAYTELGKQLNSDIIYLRVLGLDIVVLNSAQAASDILEKRSAISSDRVCPPMIKDPALLDWYEFPSMQGNNELWRHHRRMLNNWLNPRAARQFDRLQEDETKLLLSRLVDVSNDPKPFARVKHYILFDMASTMFQLSYGYPLKKANDQFFVQGTQTTHNLFDASMYTNYLVNIIPALSVLPDWLPGMSWKRKASYWRKCKEKALDDPYEWTKSQVAAGNPEPSILGALVQDHALVSGLSPDERDRRLKQLGMLMYIGGTDTTSAALMNFVAAMVLNPHVQEKAQSEVDAVIDQGARLPSIADRAQLPYIQNLITEVLRWRPVGPTGGPPHVSSEDDTYRGYEIKKGTILIGNQWAMSRDENVYKNPEVFDPDRFLDPNVPPLPAFGWGRRKCPGMHFAEATLFIVISSLLATFTFSRKKDIHGNDIIPKLEDTGNALALELKPFEFELRPRSEKHRQLILEATHKYE